MTDQPDSGFVNVPVYQVDADGNLLPNPLFHRSLDKLHSRTIEYPFAASQVKDAQVILDVGSAQAGPVWLSWLDHLPIKVYATDFDLPDHDFKHIQFVRADVRQLPFPDHNFDKITAASVIEHIGVGDAQVTGAEKPTMDADGDVKAFAELVRTLKPGGEVIMTVPFGITDDIVLGCARSYTAATIKKFHALAEPVLLAYYEYQHIETQTLFRENRAESGIARVLKCCLRRCWPSAHRRLRQSRLGPPPRATGSGTSLPSITGAVTWRQIPIEQAKATNRGHVEGVLCGVWRKQ